jgi:hypothetical protein
MSRTHDAPLRRAGTNEFQKTSRDVGAGGGRAVAAASAVRLGGNWFCFGADRVSGETGDLELRADNLADRGGQFAFGGDDTRLGGLWKAELRTRFSAPVAIASVS